MLFAFRAAGGGGGGGWRRGGGVGLATIQLGQRAFDMKSTRRGEVGEEVEEGGGVRLL